MRKISATYVFPVSSPPVRNGIITINDRGRITGIKDPGDRFLEIAGLEYYNGILVPSFILAGGVPVPETDRPIPLEQLFPEMSRLQETEKYTFDRLLKNVTLEEAKKRGLQNELGSFEEGKTPGVLLIHPFDFELWFPARNALVKRLV